MEKQLRERAKEAEGLDEARVRLEEERASLREEVEAAEVSEASGIPTAAARLAEVEAALAAKTEEATEARRRVRATQESLEKQLTDFTVHSECVFF